ncbi:MAG TPA: response regulator [Pyrinomonadaceae bacterium]
MQNNFPTGEMHRVVDSLPVMMSSYILSGNPNDGNKPQTLTIDDTEKQTSKPRALVVDDSPDVTEMLAMLLRYSGYDVVTVFSALDALDTAETEQFDVVVSDIGMPGMNGYELAEKLRATNTYSTVPMIAVTGFAMYDDRDRALESGFDAFLTKPINPMDLIDLIKRMRGGGGRT